MTTNEVGFIVDKIAEKLNVAVDKVQPIAQETLRQYSHRELFYGLSNIGLAVTFIIFIFICNHKIKNIEDEEQRAVIRVISYVLISIGSIITVSLGINYIGNYLAPIPSVMGF